MALLDIHVKIMQNEVKYDLWLCDVLFFQYSFITLTNNFLLLYKIQEILVFHSS